MITSFVMPVLRGVVIAVTVKLIVDAINERKKKQLMLAAPPLLRGALPSPAYPALMASGPTNPTVAQTIMKWARQGHLTIVEKTDKFLRLASKDGAVTIQMDEQYTLVSSASHATIEAWRLLFLKK